MEDVFLEVVTSPNCPFSHRALEVARKVASRKFGAKVILREVSTATQEGAARASEFEVSSTPAISVNGRVAFLGVPEPKELEGAIRQFLESEGYRKSYFF